MTFTCNSVSIGKSAAEHRAMPSDSAPIMVPKEIRGGNNEAGREEGREEGQPMGRISDREGGRKGGKQLERISDREGEI